MSICSLQHVRRLFCFLINWGEFREAGKSYNEKSALENAFSKSSKKAILKVWGILFPMQQMSFLKNQKLFHGGELSLGKRKITRPLCSKRSIHLTLKSNKPTLRANKDKVEKAARKYAKRFGIKIYQESAQRDHYHLLIRISSRQSYSKFIRALTSYLARHFGRGLWKLRPFSRVIQWGRSYKLVKEYIELNEREILGLQPYKKRKDLYARFKAAG